MSPKSEWPEAIRRMEELLQPLYGTRAGAIAAELSARIEGWRARLGSSGAGGGRAGAEKRLGEDEVMLIAYGDSIREVGRPPLATLKDFLDRYAAGLISALHILPMYPSSSDDGFSVVDYREIEPSLGNWRDIEALAADYELMFDAVVNHVSRSSSWFQAFLRGDPAYANFFIRRRPGSDYSRVVRPRALPLFTEFETARGKESVWTTFSEDQVDLNFAEPRVLVEAMDTLLFYAVRGARFIRLDAVGFIWKEEGGSCLNLPGAHALVKLARLALDLLGLGTTIITETNVPHDENLAYFGTGDEAELVYQFPLPPLVLFSFLSGRAEKLGTWAASLEESPPPPGCSWFNFLASHDGIGLRPTEGILEEGEVELLVRRTLERGGCVGYRSGTEGRREAYELNISYIDALSDPDAGEELRARRFVAAHAVLLSLDGLPGIYLHSLVGSRNWRKGVEDSGINRRINREKLDFGALRAELDAEHGLRKLVYEGISRLLRLRRSQPAFAPGSPQRVLSLDPRVFALERGEAGTRLLALVNVSEQALSLELAYAGRDLISGEELSPGRLAMAPAQSRWIRLS